jgi:Flp pilus assembly protein TadD
MKTMILLTLVLLTSCASNKQRYVIKDQGLDGLRNESLHRYSKTRLLKYGAKSALKMCHLEQFDQAQKQFIQQMDKRKKDPQYWSDMGTCYYLQQQYTKAKFYYQLALGLAKNSRQKSAIINNIGLIFLSNHKFDEARDHFQQASKHDSRALTPKYNLAHIYLYFGHYKNAEKILISLYNINRQDVDFIYLLGHTKLMQNKFKQAKYYFNQIPKEYSTRQDIANNIAMLYLKMGNIKKAKAVLANGDKVGSLQTLNAYVELEKAINQKIN